MFPPQVVQSAGWAAASAHSRGPTPLCTPFTFLPCLSFSPGGLAAGRAASTRNPGHSSLTKHRLSPGSCGASAWLQIRSFQPALPSTPALACSRREWHPPVPALPWDGTQQGTGGHNGVLSLPRGLGDSVASWGQAAMGTKHALLKGQRDELPLLPCSQPGAAQRVRRGDTSPSAGGNATPQPLPPPKIPAQHSFLINALYYLTVTITSHSQQKWLL